MPNKIVLLSEHNKSLKKGAKCVEELEKKNQELALQNGKNLIEKNKIMNKLRK